MEKKVMVIPNDDNELNDFIEEITEGLRDRMNCDTARDFIRSKALPGPLLAEFEVNSINDCNTAHDELIDLFFKKDQSKPVTILILGGKK